MQETRTFQKPILLITFNRPETTARVLEAISVVKPSRLYVFSDGPRSGHPGDHAKIDAVRKLFLDLPWNVELKTNYKTKNVGCAHGVSGAISWVLEQEEDVVILEDDCVPHPSFFTFCETMLDRFADNPKVFHVSGTRWNPEYPIGHSYFFSSIGHIWGWATWRRAWRHYRLSIPDWRSGLPAIQQAVLNPINVQFWKEVFRSVEGDHPSTWDYQWQFALFSNHALAVVPDVNLVSNIGAEGAHYSNSNTRTFGRYALAADTSSWKDSNPTKAVRQHVDFDLHHMRRHFLRQWSPLKRVKKLIKFYVQR